MIRAVYGNIIRGAHHVHLDHHHERFPESRTLAGQKKLSLELLQFFFNL